MNNEMETMIMNLIVDAGSARSYAMDAIRLAKEGCIEEAEASLDNSDADIGMAHRGQTDLIHNEAKGVHTEMSLFMVHAQDHIMTAILARDLAREFVDLYKTLRKDGYDHENHFQR